MGQHNHPGSSICIIWRCNCINWTGSILIQPCAYNIIIFSELCLTVCINYFHHHLGWKKSANDALKVTCPEYCRALLDMKTHWLNCRPIATPDRAPRKVSTFFCAWMYHEWKWQMDISSCGTSEKCTDDMSNHSNPAKSSRRLPPLVHPSNANRFQPTGYRQGRSNATSTIQGPPGKQRSQDIPARSGYFKGYFGFDGKMK